MGFGPAGPGMDGEEGVAAVILVKEERLELCLIQALGQSGKGLIKLCANILSLGSQLG